MKLNVESIIGTSYIIKGSYNNIMYNYYNPYLLLTHFSYTHNVNS